MVENSNFVPDQDTENNKTHHETKPTPDSSNTLEDIELQVVPKVAEEEEEADPYKLFYKLEDNPPIYLAALLGLQHYLTMVGAMILLPFILAPHFCIQADDPARGYFLSTLFFASGIGTLLQVTFGVRLPIVQGGTFAFIVPIIVILHTKFAPCSSLDYGNMTRAQTDEEWQSRIREIQGAIAVSSLFQIIVGFTGLIGLVATVITPLAIVPTIALIGLSMFEVATDKAGTQWGIAAMTIVLMVLFSQYLRNVAVPLPTYKRGRGIVFIRAKVFGLFPVLLAIVISWATCAILTISGALPEDSAARTDKAAEMIANSPWIRVPYPGQYGVPTVSVAGVFGMLAGVLASIIESLGDYYACAKIAGAPPPPRHAINRGVGMEGIGCLLAAILGAGTGLTSYSENIAAIGLTKVASRRVMQCGAVIMMLCGVLGKIAAVFVSIPDPVVGGIFCVMAGIVTAVGLSALENVDLKSSRNLFVLGFPIFFGLALSKWLENNPKAIYSEDYPIVTQIVTVLLRTSMFVGGCLGVILDNTVPGTDKERGILEWNASRSRTDTQTAGEQEHAKSSVYDMPFGMSYIRRISWLRKVPFSPTFK